jgi:curli biogenesis system outer membrane secretion channel CsgG
MQKMILVAIVLALATGCVGTAVAKKEPDVKLDDTYPPRLKSQRMKVAVVDFEDKTNYGKGQLGNGAADVTATVFHDSKQFRVFERQQLAAVLSEQKLQHSGAVNPTTAKEIGQLTGVDAIVYGAVTMFGMAAEGQNYAIYKRKKVSAECTVDVRIIDVKTGEILFAKQGDGIAYMAASQVLGMGGRIGFNQTLAEKSLRAAIVKMMDEIIAEIYEGE